MPTKLILVGTWRLLTGELELRKNGTWVLRWSGKFPPMFDLLAVREGKWKYTRAGGQDFPLGALIFARSNGGRGFFVRIIDFERGKLCVDNGEGGRMTFARIV
jgi:hypothetical protein